MTITTNIHPTRSPVREAVRRGRGFSLIEIMVTVTLLAVIILGLVTMFNQTQRAFTTSLNQVDVLEGGRTACDMIARELEQNIPSYYSLVYNFDVIPPVNTPVLSHNYVWPLVNPPDVRTNVMERLYFLTRYNQQWNAVGFALDLSSVTNGVGTLYRYNATNVAASNLFSQLNNFVLAASISPLSTNTNFNRIIDGVVNFRIRTFGTNGGLLFNTTNAASTFKVFTNSISGNESLYQFQNNAVPAYVEVELGILETRTLERYRSYSNSPALALNYLTNHAAQVHIFRQRVPIRAVDAAAYP